MTEEPSFCYLTTTGRRTHRPHEIEIWFARQGHTVYLLSSGRDTADWVRNLQRDPRVSVRIGTSTHQATARVVDPGKDEDAVARRLLLEKYQTSAGEDLTDWGRMALPVALDLVC
jgi:deazaflavin-dependent oxidoreductase (nitroreductase family)